MKQELSALIADYKAGRIGADVVKDRLNGLRAAARTYELSEGQRGLWVLQQSYPDMIAYNVPLCFRVNDLDVELWERACRSVITRHPVLSTVIDLDGDKPVQSVDPQRELDFEHVELSGRNNTEALDAIKRESKRPFAMSGELLLRIRVFQRFDEYTVLITVHHIIFDGTSARLLMRDLLEAYQALVDGRVPATGRQPAAFQDFVEHEQRTLAERRQAVLGYWREKLAPPLVPLNLPTDRPHMAVVDRFAGDTYYSDLPAELAARIEKLSTDTRAYVSSAMLAAFAVTLASYSDERELVVGMPVNERTNPAHAEAVGLIMTMMPVRVQFADEQFHDLVIRVQREVADGMAHAYPFATLAREIALERQADRSPVFQVAFIYQDVLDGLEGRFLPELHQEGEYELSVELWRRQDGSFSLHWKYHPELFSREFVAELADRYERVLGDVTTTPSVRVGELRDSSVCVHDMAEAAAELWPDRIAASDKDQCLTYRELSKRSNELAATLRSQGVGRGQLVTVFLNRSVDVVVSLLGILKAGAAYVPLDPEFPTERLVDIVDDCAPTLMITQPDLAGRARTLGSVTMFVLGDTVLGQAVYSPVKVGESDLAYVIYTSGSTGKPKGVMIPHRGFINLMRSMLVWPGMTQTDTLFAVTTISFDMAQLELFMPLVCGAHCYICDTPTIKDIDRLKASIDHVRPTVMQATPATWSMLFHSGWQNPGKLRIFCGGEAMSRELKEYFLDTATEAWNLYGPTEATVYSTGTLIRRDAPITIGKPVANTRIHILDKDLQPVPHGETGELCIAGTGLAVGYLNRPELTAQKFVDHPTAGRLYRTGDLASWTDDGEVDYLGRMDFQVKIRGYRIELGDIEYHLGRHEDIAECVVVATGEDAAKRLVAYYVPKREADTKAFKQHLKDKLPAYMIPDFFIAIDVIPLTGSGKVDRTALSRREIILAVQPQVEVYAEVLACWRDVLQIRDLDPSVSFFDAGGQSLAAVVLAKRISDQLGVPFAAADLFKYTTVRAIADHVLGSEPSAPVETPGIIVEADVPADALAVVGIACQVTGAEDHWEFWENLKQGKGSTRFWSEEELRAAGVDENLSRDKNYVPLRTDLDGKDCFDGEFFRLSPNHIAMMDPQFRLMLPHAWRAVEDAGYNHRDIPDTAVFVTGANHSYGAPDDSSVIDDPQQYLSWVMRQSGTVASMISYQLGFGGPSMAVHSNCSSSLTALALAARAVQAGDADFALVVAASASSIDGRGYVYQPGLNFSSDGRVKAFDAGANGMVGGEGVAAILIRRASDAVASGDHIYGLLRGVATNNDGGDATGYYSPSVNGQARVVRRALEQAGVDPATIGYVEAHGTGTKLGDPVELTALTEAYGTGGSCGIGSVKSNLGHLDTAAGLIGSIKVLLSLYHGQLAPTINYTSPNPELRLAETPFYVIDSLREWTAGETPRRAGQSSIGLGGSNAHAVFEEHVTTDPPADDGSARIVPLSAKAPENLVRYAERLLTRLEGSSLRLRDVAYTLQVGRAPMPQRVAFVVRDIDELKAELALFGLGAESSRRFTGQAGTKATVKGVKPKKIAKGWVAGAEIAWAVTGKRVSLPTYPFTPVRHPWTARERTAVGAIPLHPLAHENVSRLGEVRYRTRFTGEEYLLREHVVHGKRLLPAVASLEMAHAVVTQAVGADGISLRNVTWVRPVEVGSGGRTVEFTLSRAGQRLAFQLLCDDQVHVQGNVVIGATVPLPAIDLDRLRAESRLRRLSGEECYEHTTRAGVDYGPCFRLVRTIHRGTAGALAELRLPESLRGEGFTLHPSVLDAAIHASLGLDLQWDSTSVPSQGGTSVPFALERLDVFAAFNGVMYAWVRHAANHRDGMTVLDIDIADERGRICASLRGLTYRALATPDSTLHTLVPVWEPRNLGPAVESGPTLVLDAGQRLNFAGHQRVVLGPDASIEQITERLRAAGVFAHLMWVAPHDVAQESGVIEVFRIAKALLALGLGITPLTWTVLTSGTQQVNASDKVTAAHASVHGFMGSLAKEQARWTIRLIDLPGTASTVDLPAVDLPAVDLPAVDPDLSGRTLAVRDGRWFSQELREIPALQPSEPPYKHRGVYVVVGGAGGIGALWSQSLVRRHQAAIVWIGRRPFAEEIERKLIELAKLAAEYGAEAPMYISADARDEASLHETYLQIKQRHARVDGVVHSAIVLADKTVANMDEDRLRAALSCKVDIGVNLVHVFRDVDFLLFFSSVESFAREAGQANYAAGCTFKDALALQLQGSGPIVKAINWGYWGTAGVVSDPYYRGRMADAGVDSLDPDEGFETLGHFLGGDHSQVVLMRTFTDAPLRGLAYQAPNNEIDLLRPFLTHPRMNELSLRLLQAILRDLDKPVLAKYERWQRESERLLADLEDQVTLIVQLWQSWRDERADWQPNANQAAQVDLVEACLRALPEVLTGARPATELLFPGSSLTTVERIYRDEPIACYFNDQLSALATATVQAWTKSDPTRRIRVLEVGAGTGATSAKVLAALRPFAANIEEYCFTDLSKAFLFGAEERLQATHPYLTTRIFNAERSPQEQAIPLGQFDLVVATNVLHATADIAETLRNVKATMRPHGLLLINEMSCNTIPAHLTFGLLDGWWLYRDPEVRIEGSPVLTAERWRELLLAQGFSRVTQPNAAAHELGQQLTVAENGGVVVGGDLREQTVAYFERLVRGALRLTGELDSSRDLHDYGLDSILVAGLTNTVAEDFADVDNTLFFEYRTVDELVNHFFTARQPELVALFGSSEPMVDLSLRERAVAHFTNLAAAILRIGAEELPADRNLFDAGLDSILVIRMINALNQDFADVDSSLFFEASTIDAIVDHFLETRRDQLTRALGSVDPQPVRVVVEPPRTKDIAIVGLAGRYPGADNPEELWRNVRQGVDATAEYPAERWWVDWQDRPSPRGGFLSDVGSFDADFFGVPADEAAAMDPQERLFIETVHSAVQDAGYTAAGLNEQGRVSVFAGVMNSTYNGRTAYSSIVNRASYLFDFQGPSIAIDTACSASLTAVHLAMESLHSGDNACAIAGGVNLLLSRDHFTVLYENGLLSAGDRCSPFSEHADGFLAAEGVGAVVLRPLADAVAAGDHIYAVIKGSAVNAGGRTGRYSMPNLHAQRDVVARALEKSQVDPGTISYVEAHGSATLLGDSIEISALSRAFGTARAGQYCAVGSLKSNIGHCESASGIAGLTKVLMQLRHCQLAPSINADELNSGIGFVRSPFQIQRTLAPWTPVDADGREIPRRAGISCFGAGGSNAHLVIEQHTGGDVSDDREHADGNTYMVPLSASTPEQLTTMTRLLADHLAATPVVLADLAYTLQVGRDELSVRQVYVVSSTAELLAAINGERPAGTSELAQRWLDGGVVQWRELYSGRLPRRVSLPTYPFARTQHWFRAETPAVPVPQVEDGVLGQLRRMAAQELAVGEHSVDPAASFAGLGLSSIALVRMAREIRREFDPGFDTALLFEYDTFAKLAGYLGGAETPVVTSHPLSHGQQGLWAVQKASPESSAYNVPLCFRVTALNVDALSCAFDLVIARHRVLGSVVNAEGGTLLLMPSGVKPSVQRRPMTGDDAIREHAMRPFDLENGPLCELTVFESPGESSVLLNAHHLVLDGASAVVLVKDLLTTYQALLDGRVPAAPASAPYAEFVADEAAVIAAQGQKRLAYWRERLAGPLPALALPTDRPRSEAGSRAGGATVTLPLPAELAEHVAAFGREQGIYPSALFLAAFKVLLRQYTQQDDVIVGMPVNGRPDERFQGTVGYFLTMVPVRSTLTAAQPFAALCKDVQRNLIASVEHSHPFTEVVRELGLSAMDSGSPVFSYAFMYQDWHEDVTAGVPSVQYVDGIHQEGEYELVLEVVNSDGFAVNWKYIPALFDAETIENLARQYQHLLESVLADPHKSVDHCSLVSPEERHRLTVEWNDTAAEYPDLSVPELFAEQATLTPDAPALVYGRESLTYRELDDRVTQFARRLAGLGVGRGSLVAVCLERSPELVIALLATMRAGGAYIPLDPSYPRYRVSYILRDAGAHVTLCHSSLRGQIDAPNMVMIDEPWEHIESVVTATPSGTDLAYVIYTSGSTGNPKGVMVPHRALTNFLSAMAKRPGLMAGERVLAVTTHSFDIAALELYLPLITGATCHLADAASVQDAGRLMALINQAQPTVVQATPSTWTMLLLGGWTNPGRTRVLCGGEAMPEALKDRLVALGCEVWNLFGPTETTIWSTVERVTADRRVTIGHPIDNTQVHILDEHGRLVPTGAPGELCIGGDGLALGYFGKPELTAERFQENPFQSGRLYRTGDLARRLSDGSIVWLSRIDSQVKIRGFRVELGEIEHVLAAYPGVRECAVVARSQAGSSQLVAYFTAERLPVDSADLAGHLEKSLPDYMIPAFVLPIDALPKTPNGKVDRNTLAARSIAAPHQPEVQATVSLDETEVVSLWQEVLGVDNLRPTDGFLDAGGSSVMAAVLADRAGKRFGVPVAPADIFRFANARGMSEHLCGKTHAPAAPDYLDESVAIIGVSCGLPGARDHREFWGNLVSGAESVRLCAEDELRSLGVAERLIGDPKFVPAFASMAGKGMFDPDFFQISARDAELMDPQARLLLQQSWKAVEDAAYRPGDLADAAVYMSTSNALYQAPLVDRDTQRDSEALVSFLMAQPGTIPTTISHKLGLHGPSLFVHSNCSSSLAGMALAFQEIRSGHRKHALVGGATVYGENTVGYLHEDGMTLSADGHCRPFSDDAAGMVGAEGVVVVVLKDARAAVDDGDNIYALLRGVGMNNDGARKAGYHAPGVAGQAEVISAVLDSAGVEPESIKYLEAHGTGTRLGDPIEVMALSDAFRGRTNATGFCGIGSVKSNIGHLDAAAGLAGCLKAALVLNTGLMPPTANFRAVNPAIDFARSPFYVVDRLTELEPSDLPLRAAVSSFGIGGTNVHAILEAPPVSDTQDFTGPFVVPLSARTSSNLRQYARDLADRLADESLRPGDVAFTLQFGRTEMAVRVAFEVQDIPELLDALRDFVDGTAPRVDNALARSWIEGGSADWSRLYSSERRPRRVSLPTYPFTEEYYWLPKNAPLVVPQDAPVFFEERWVPAEINSRKVSAQVVACVLAEEKQEAFRHAMRDRAPDTSLVFLTPGDTPSQATDAIYYFVSPDEPLSDLASVVRAAQTTDFLVAGQFHTAVEQATVDALIGFERSLSGGPRVILHEGETSAERWADVLLAEHGSRDKASALYRNEQRHVCRVERVPAPGPATVLRTGGTYLITGAFGGLARRLAEYLARVYRTNLILLGRTLSSADESWAASLTGGAITCHQVDVTDEAALAALVLPPLDGVIHAAATADTTPLSDKTNAAFEAVLAAKVRGTLAVDRVFGPKTRDFVCYFSSTSATLGDFGGCDYAVGNRFQAAYARALRDHGAARVPIAIEWPLWQDGGMGASVQRRTHPGFVESYLTATGQHPLDTATGHEIFANLLGAGYVSPLVLHATPSQANNMIQRALRPALAEGTLSAEVRAVVQDLLKVPAKKLDDQSSFADLGVDSIRLTQLAHRLAERLGVTLSPTELYDYPSIKELVGHLASLNIQHEITAPISTSDEPISTSDEPISTSDEPISTSDEPISTSDEPIAIIGASGIFPGCRSVSEFWDALVDGRDLVTALPGGRFGGEAGPYRWMGAVDWADEFDPAFFETTPKEARTMDPRQRHLLQESWKALEDAALGPDDLATLRVGVFVGVEQGDYRLLTGDGGNLTSNHDGVLAARLSYFLDLKGPVLAINTSCSSGLVALHQACLSLRQGECDVAVVAAANFVLTPESLAAMSEAGLLSPQGRCATFDESADGMVPGEAVTALVLRPFAAARGHGNPVHSVIAASGVNYDGRTNGITAPAGAAQRELISLVHRDIDPADVGLIVTHGTGTKLGDPVEVNALRAAFQQHPGSCALTSTKTNVGHTFAASGLVSLLCLSESVRRGVIPASLHCERENEYIDWTNSPFYVNKVTQDWPDQSGRPRTGAVSAFGMSGTNAHVVLRQDIPAVEVRLHRERSYLLVLSAKTEAALERRVDDLLAWISRGDVIDADLPRLSETLLGGRHHFRHRCAIVIDTLDEAAALWKLWCERATHETECRWFGGTVPRDFTTSVSDNDRIAADVERVRGRGTADRRDALNALARSYTEGHAIPWPYEQRPMRLRLPTYPFARNRYWVGTVPSEPVVVVEPDASRITLADLSDYPATLGERFVEALPAQLTPVHRAPVVKQHDVLEDLKTAGNIGFDGMVVTLNRTGVMVESLIPYASDFAEYAGTCGGEALDLGCAYGVASIAALERGARVVALDMEQKHLDILGQRVTDEARSRLTLVCGVLPDIDFADGRFTAIHAGRVMHFLGPEQVRETLRRMMRWLVPGGKVFLTTDSPYFGYWASKAVDYDRRKLAGDPWPGYIDDVSAHFPPADVVNGPNVINALDPDVFRRECTAAGFIVERAGFFGSVGVQRSSHGAPGPDMEHVGVIATKPSVVHAADGTEISYRVTGSGRTALVFVHGLGCDATYWDNQVSDFSGRFTVVTVDLAGHGRSGRDRQRWTVEAFAQDIADVVAHLGLSNVVLVGHSLGGPIMLAAAPLLSGRLQGMIGVDTLHNVEPKALSERQIDRFVRTFADNPVRSDELILGQARPELVELVERTRAEVGTEIISAVFREMVRYLQAVPAPTGKPLVLVNSSSWMPTNMAAARRYGAEVELIDGIGHFVMLEKPDVLTASLRRHIEEMIR